MTFDPATLALSDWRRAAYAGSPWGPTASAGTSGGRGGMAEATNPATVGTSVNGFGTASFDGTAKILVEDTYNLDQIISTTAWSLSVLVKPTATAAVRSVGAGYNDPAICSETVQGYWYLTYTTSGVTIGHYDPTAGVWLEANQACSSGSWHLVHAWFDGTNISISVDNAAATSTASTDQGVTGVGRTTLGKAFAAAFFAGLIAETMVAPTDLGATARLNIGRYSQDRFALKLGFPIEPIDLVRYSERVDRRQMDRLRMHASRMQSFAGRVDPPTATVALLQPNRATAPDAIDRERTRGRTHPSRMPGITSLSPLPIPVVTTTFAHGRATYPDRLPRLTFATHLQDCSELPPLTIVTAVPAVTPVSYPHAAPRPRFLAHLQDAFELPPPAAVIQALTPVGLTTAYPDAIARIAAHTSRQSVVVGSPQPERMLQAYDVEWPDRVPRPWFSTAAQQHVVAPSPVPEQPLPMADTEYPSRVVRPTYPTTAQLAVTGLSPAPEQPSPIAVVVAPERVVRPAFGIAQQRALTTDVPPAPEQAIVSAWEAFAPDRVTRPVLPAGQHQTFAMWAVAIPTPAPALAVASFPDAVRRPALHPANQRPAFLDPFPLATAAITQIQAGYVIAPDAIRRPSFLAAHQLPTTSVPPAPEMTVAPSDVRYPDAIARPRFTAGQQLAVTQLAPAPERTATSFEVSFPDRIPRPSFPAAQQQPAVLWALPLPTFVPALADARYPDAVRRPSMPAANQWASWIDPLPIATAALTQIQAGYVVAPDAIRRAAMPTAHHQAATSPPSMPEQTAALDWQTLAPEAVRRPTFRPEQQQVTAMPAQPERTAPLAFVHAPDRVARPALHAGLQHAFAMAPLPVVVSVAGLATYQDTVRRAVVHSATAGASVFSPRPIVVTTPVALTNYPDAVRRPFFHVSQQLHYPLGSFLTPAAAILLPACLTGVLTLATTLTGTIVEATVLAATLAISTSAFGALTGTTTEEGVLTISTSEPGVTEGCNE